MTQKQNEELDEQKRQLDEQKRQLADQHVQLTVCHELLQAAILLIAEYAEMSNDPDAIAACAEFVVRAAELGDVE